MKIACYLDTNILIYAATAKRHDPHKYEIARRLLLDSDFGVSGQILAEFCSVTRKKNLLSDGELNDWLFHLCELPFLAIDQALVLGGLALSRRYKISYYDAAHIAAADRLGAAIIYTEDLNHHQLYGSVRAVNPFLEH